MASATFQPLVPFGREMRDKHFLLAPGYTPLNHGAYGTYPRAVQVRLLECQLLAEARPDAWMRHEIPKRIDASRSAMAEYLGVARDEVVFLPNATTAINVILRSLTFRKGDVIVHFSTVYESVGKTVDYLKETTPVDNISIELAHPMSDDSVIGAFREGLQLAKRQGRKARVAVFDTVTSSPGILNPWERLVRLCKEENILSLLDGAHGIGHLPLDLARAQPDFFTSNLHKWLFVPRGCAVLQVPKRNQHLIRSSLPTSLGFVPLDDDGGDRSMANPVRASGNSPFVRLFEYTATIDASPYACVESALKFRSEVCGGEERIMDHCRKLSSEGGQMMAKILGTEVMENSKGSLCQCAFSNVRLPLQFGSGRDEIPKEYATKVQQWIAGHLIQDHDTYANTYFHAGFLWTRLSGQIYLEVDDFVRGAKAFEELCSRIRAGEYLV